MKLLYQRLPDAEQVYLSHEGVEETDRNEYCFMLHNNSTSNIARILFTSILFLLQLQPTFEVLLKSPSKSRLVINMGVIATLIYILLHTTSLASPLFHHKIEASLPLIFIYPPTTATRTSPLFLEIVY
jgi:hypothetical protein